MKVVRRLFFVLLADNDHGKTTMIKALVSQGLGRTFQRQRKGVRSLTSPYGRPVDAYIYGSSYQEHEKAKYGSVERALYANDPEWRIRELIVMPSHVSDIDNGSKNDDIDQMINAGRGAGFDMICAAVLFMDPDADNLANYADVWRKSWDERWTVPNPYNEDPEGQLVALGHDIWTWVSGALAS